MRRDPHEITRPSHFIVREDPDGYYAICPIGRDPSEVIYRGPQQRPFSIVTRIPVDEVVFFEGLHSSQT